MYTLAPHTYILMKHKQISLCVVIAATLASAVPILVSTKATGTTVNMVPSDTEEDNTEDEASTAPNTQPAPEAPTVAKTPSPINGDMPAHSEAKTGKIFKLEYN